MNSIFGVLKSEGFIACNYADNRAWVGQITFEGKHYFDDKKLLVGKLRLIELIDETDEIEKAFHTVGGGGVPEVEEIHDTEVFQYWLQEILFELESLPDAKLPGFIFDTINQ